MHPFDDLTSHIEGSSASPASARAFGRYVTRNPSRGFALPFEVSDIAKLRADAPDYSVHLAKRDARLDFEASDLDFLERSKKIEGDHLDFWVRPEIFEG